MTLIYMFTCFCVGLIIGFALCAMLVASGERDTDQISKGRF